MNKSFDQKYIDDAIKAKDYIRLKNYVINAVRNNPGFRKKENENCSEATGVFKELMAREDELPGLFTPYELQYKENEFNEEDKRRWTQDYFTEQTFFLGENFCPERFNHVQKIGQYLAGLKKAEPVKKNQLMSFEKNTGMQYIFSLLRSIMPRWLKKIFGL